MDRNSAEQGLNPEYKNKALPTIKFDANKTQAFCKLIDTFGIDNIFFFAQPPFRKEAEFRLKDILHIWSEDMQPVLQNLDGLSRQIEGAAYNENTLEFSQRLIFRCVGEIASGKKTDELIADASINGGKSPRDTSVGICMDDGHKIKKYIQWGIERGENMALFIYDKSKLQGLTEEERATDINFAAGYGVKPKEGLKLSDTLLGTIDLEAKKS